MVDSFFKPILLFYALGPKCCWLVAKLYRTLVIPWVAARQAATSMEFSRQEYWSGLPFPSPGGLPDPGVVLTSLALAGFFTTEPPVKPYYAVCPKLCGLNCVRGPWVGKSTGCLDLLWCLICSVLVKNFSLVTPQLVTQNHPFYFSIIQQVCFWQFKIYNSLNHPTFMLSFKDFFFLMWTVFKVSVEFVIILLLCFGLLAVRHTGSSLLEVLMSNVISGLKSMSPRTLLFSSPCSFVSSTLPVIPGEPIPSNGRDMESSSAQGL